MRSEKGKASVSFGGRQNRTMSVFSKGKKGKDVFVWLNVTRLDVTINTML
jgi:hypothetical protein